MQSSSWETATFPGLISVLENPKWPVSKACQAVEDCIASNRDNLRGFFEQCFPALLKRLFGYDGPSWLTLVAKSPKESDATALLRLLSPTGALFSAMYSADSDGSTRFVFPRERLPTHTQVLLAEPAGRRTLERWPQYAGAVVADASGRVHIHLGVYQYFLFWFAFYAIKGGDGEGLLRPAAAGITSSVRKAADALHLTRSGRESEAMRHPYQAALRQLLLELLPRPANAAQAAAAASPGKAGGSPFYRGGGGRRQADLATRGLTFYSTLLEFWVADGDEPVPLSSTAAAAERGPAAPEPSSLGPRWSTTYEPPSEDLLAALEELVKYATAVDAGTKGVQPAQGAASWLPLAPMHTLLPPQAASRVAPAVAGPSRLGAPAQPPAQALARRLFRFFFRAFTLWPDRRSIKPILRVFLAYVAPWRSASSAPLAAPGAFMAAPGQSALSSHLTTHIMSDLVHRVADGGARPAGSGKYGREWEAHVLSNLPFYTVLLPVFLEMGAARLQIRGETAAHDILTVFGVLEEAPELREMVARVERDAARFAASQPRRAEGPYAELLPWLAEQGYDWELAATVNITGDTPLLRQTAPVSTLFSTSDAGAAFLARELLDMSAHVLKAEPQARLKGCLEAVLPLAALPDHPAQAAARVQEAAAYDDVVPRLPRSSWRDVQYKGDPLGRPVASFELALLVRLLVALSRRANAWLQLDRAWSADDDAPENMLQEGIAWLRRRGHRVNLRPLADVRNLAWLPPALLAAHFALRLLLSGLGMLFSWIFSLIRPEHPQATVGRAS